MKSLFRRTLPAALSAALALTTATTAPARAEVTPLEAFAIGVGVIGVIAATTATATPAPPPAPVYVMPPNPKPKPVVVHSPLWVPRSCLREVRSSSRVWRVFPLSCLGKSGVTVNTLPSACRVRIVSGSGDYMAITASCILSRGYVLR